MAITWLCACVLLSASFSVSTSDDDIFFGTIEPVDVFDRNIQEAALFAFQALEFNHNYKLMEVTSAEKKVVAGVYYYLSMEIEKNEHSNFPLRMTCELEVYCRPWEKTMLLEKCNCSKK